MRNPKIHTRDVQVVTEFLPHSAGGTYIDKTTSSGAIYYLMIFLLSKNVLSKINYRRLYYYIFHYQYTGISVGLSNFQRTSLQHLPVIVKNLETNLIAYKLNMWQCGLAFLPFSFPGSRPNQFNSPHILVLYVAIIFCFGCWARS